MQIEPSSEAPAPLVPVAQPLAEAGSLVVLVGNPNVGKTTLFNQLTGENARVGNYSGVTVECRSGRLRKRGSSAGASPKVELLDIPGTYSLSARSGEEQIALHAALGLSGNRKPDLCVVVVDAGQLIRNLYLVVQLAELGVPLVIALNMIDEVAHNPPHTEALSRLFGVPCVALDARRGQGVPELTETIVRALGQPPRSAVRVPYPDALRPDVDRIAELLPSDWRGDVERDRALARWALTSVAPDDELEHLDPELRARCLELLEASGRDLDQEIIAARYAFLDARAHELYREAEPHPPKRALSERLDRVLLHPIFGFALFIVVMCLIFQALFSWSDPAIGLIEDAIAFLQSSAVTRLPEGILRDVLVEGVLGGVGNVIVFLPQILLLFFFIGLLEDSGYMARVAYLMDRIMKGLGLHGRAFVPMLSGFACAVPAILATRTMERKRDRLLTMLVIPLMTCSARLPVYTLIIAALIPPALLFGWLPVQGLLMVAMYVLAIALTLLTAAILGRTLVRGRRVPLILELPPYRLPSLRTTLRMMKERSWVFVREAGTVILVCTIVLWGLLSFPRAPASAEAGAAATATAQAAAENGAAQSQLENSYAGRLGKAIEPALAPLGFDWKIGVGIIGAFAAREVFVSTLGLVYGIGEVDDEAIPLRERLRNEKSAEGRPKYTALTGLSLLVFFALACQCMSTLAVVRRETHTWRWPIFMFVYMTALAWIASFLVYQLGSWFSA
ncbi:MAG TPA: ferrous iron transport protein B [Polyangiaceae bacterium]